MCSHHVLEALKVPYWANNHWDILGHIRRQLIGGPPVLGWPSFQSLGTVRLAKHLSWGQTHLKALGSLVPPTKLGIQTISKLGLGTQWQFSTATFFPPCLSSRVTDWHNIRCHHEFGEMKQPAWKTNQKNEDPFSVPGEVFMFFPLGFLFWAENTTPICWVGAFWLSQWDIR